jgi:hypothetical protein
VSVQAAVSSSVAGLLEHIQKHDLALVQRYVSQVERLWGRWWLCWAPRGAPPVAEWCQDDKVHSQHGLTFGELLQRVWTVVVNHPDRDGLKRVLKDELEAGRDVCFTGRFSRVLNALTGFVDGVRVDISDREHMQARIATIVKSGGDVESMVAKVEEVLDDFHVPLADRGPWLDAVLDIPGSST